MASDILDRVGMVITDTGTGSVTANVLISDRFNTPAEAAAVDGKSYWWMLEEGNDYQIFEGVWTSATKKVARTTTWQSKIAGVHSTANMNLAGNATLRSVTPAELFDVILRVDKAQSLSSGQKSQAQTNLGLGAMAVKNLSDALALTNTTDSTSSTSGAITTAGGLGVSKSINAGGAVGGKVFKSSGNPYTDPQIQLDGYTFTIVNDDISAVSPEHFYGIMILACPAVGGSAVFLCGHESATLIADVGGYFVTSDTPNKLSVVYASGFGWTVRNRLGITAGIKCGLIKAN